MSAQTKSTGSLSIPTASERGLPQHPLTKFTFQGRLMGELKSVYCPGCGYVPIFSAINRVFQEDGLDPLKFPFVVGIGCYSSAPIYLPAPAIMVLHGRAPAVCTGIKMTNPELKPVAIAGDGDTLAIGMSHFVHAARRNVDMVHVLLHNNVYGMTGGQVAPDTPEGFKATTAPYGAVEPPVDAANIAIAAGATFVARWSILQIPQLETTFRKALAHKGFSLIEVLSPCPTYFGRNNGMADPVENLRWIKDQSVLLEEARNMAPEALAGKYVLGELYETGRPELSEAYSRLKGAAGVDPELAKGEKEEMAAAESKEAKR